MRRLACVSFPVVSSRTYTKRLWSSTASQLPDTPAQLAAQQGSQGRPIRIPDLCGDLVDAGAPVSVAGDIQHAVVPHSQGGNRRSLARGSCSIGPA